MRPRHHSERSLLRRGAAILAAATVVLGPGSLPHDSAGAGTATVPIALARAGTSADVYVLASCARGSCLGLWRVSGTSDGVTMVAAPPLGPPAVGTGYDGVEVQFASVDDGVALTTPRPFPEYARLYLTTDGASTWRAATFGAGRAALALVSTPTSYLAVTARCTGRSIRCRDFALVRSPVSRIAWRTIARLDVPGYGNVQLSDMGDRVWLSEQNARGESVVLLSTDAGQHFVSFIEPDLACVAPAALVPTTPTTVWATCPTGMMVSFARSVDAGRSWTWLHFPITSGTGGAAFDPVAGDVAMFAHGLSPNVLYRVSGTRASVTRVVHLPFDENQELSFLNARDGIAIGSFGYTYHDRLLVTTDGGRSWRIVNL